MAKLSSSLQVKRVVLALPRQAGRRIHSYREKSIDIANYFEYFFGLLNNLLK